MKQPSECSGCAALHSKSYAIVCPKDSTAVAAAMRLQSADGIPTKWVIDRPPLIPYTPGTAAASQRRGKNSVANSP